MSETIANTEQNPDETTRDPRVQLPVSRRNVLIGGAAVAATLVVPQPIFALQTDMTKHSSRAKTQGDTVNTIIVKDGTSIYYKDWGTGQPIVFCHGWPLNADAWDAQMLFFGQHGYRVVAHDRRGHGRSSQPWDGNDMDHYADDLAELIEKLNLKDIILVGHSTGGGEVARYIGRHGTKRVAKAVLISAVTPFMLQTPDHPGAPMSVFDDLRKGLVSNRPEFIKGLSMAFYGYNKPDAKISEGIRESFWLQSMMGGLKCEYDSIKAFSETDFREDLSKFTIPTLVLQGDVDEIVPLQISAPLTAKLVKNSTLKIYPGLPHGLCTVAADEVNADLLAFIKS
jgi:non-heme chloroperoxidase